MSAQTVRVYALLGIWLLLSSASRAQEPRVAPQEPGAAAAPQGYLTKAEFEAWKKAEFTPLGIRVEEVASSVNALEQTRLVPIKSQLDKVSADLAKSIELYREKDAELESLAQSHDKTIQLLADQNKLQEEILLAISRRDSRDRPILALNSIMQSDEGRREIANAVEDSLRRSGTVRVRNDTGITQVLRVNGVDVSIPPYSQIAREVPAGTLTTELVGYEAPRNWTIAPPNYEAEIRITSTPVRRVYEYWRLDPWLGWVRVLGGG